MTSLKEQIWEAHPYKTRKEKLVLLKYLPFYYERIEQVAPLLHLEVPPKYDPVNSDVDDDYVILRSASNQPIADAYVGNEPDLLGHIIFPDGSEVTEHTYYVLLGRPLTEQGFIRECRCSDCQEAQLHAQIQADEQRMKRYEERAIEIGLTRTDKIRSVSDHLRDLPNFPIYPVDPPIMPKITSPSKPYDFPFHSA